MKSKKIKKQNIDDVKFIGYMMGKGLKDKLIDKERIVKEDVSKIFKDCVFIPFIPQN